MSTTRELVRFGGPVTLHDHGLAIDNLVVTVAPVPEPAGLLAAGFAAVGLFRMVRRGQRGGSARNDKHLRPVWRAR